MNINWSAIGTIAQWVGALFSGIAIYFAVKKDKPSIRLFCIHTHNLVDRGEITVTVTNKGYIPVTIEYFAIRDVKNKKSYKTFYLKNIFIEPGKKVEIDHLRIKAFNDQGINNLKKMYELVSVFDQFGNEYFMYNDLRSKAKRVLQIKLFRKTNTE